MWHYLWCLEIFSISECYFNIIMNPSSIAILSTMKMLDKRIICINVPVQLFVLCLISCVKCITTWCYTSRSDIVHTTKDVYIVLDTTDLTWYKQLYQYNRHIICIDRIMAVYHNFHQYLGYIMVVIRLHKVGGHLTWV